MLRLTGIELPLDYGEAELKAALLKKLKIPATALGGFMIRRRSVDARKRNLIRFTLTVDVLVKKEKEVLQQMGRTSKVSLAPDMSYPFVADRSLVRAAGNNRAAGGKRKRPVVVGTGPSGLFAGLILAYMGFDPLLIERGSAVEERTGQVARFWKDGTLNPESNVQFGEGGAGTFSDGKLTTQIKDPGNRVRKVLEELVAAGAPEEILVSNRPHIGTDQLVKVVAKLRRTLIGLGGEVRFNTCVSDLILEQGAVHGVVLATGEEIAADHLILAVGHSARDTYEMLHRRGVDLQAKPFSIGVRAEHPQALINACQHGPFAGHPRLGAADYKLVHHCRNGRSVYSFCMCPGGRVIAAASEAGGVVTNGMSTRARDGAAANSALLVGVKPDDFPDDSPLAGVAFQRQWEEKAFALGGGNFKAPVQRIGDFLAGRPSTGEGLEAHPMEPTYRPGITWCDLSPCLPDYVILALREAIPAFDRKIKGFAMPHALLTAVETRSSAPVRILRTETMESRSVKGLYPAGEGAGYAGGIISSAVDGIKAAEAVALASAGKDSSFSKGE